MNIFKKLKASLRYSEAVRKADEALDKTGYAHYVIPMINNELLVLNVYDLHKIRQKGCISETIVNVNDLKHKCFYHTACKYGLYQLTDSEIKDKRRSYFTWVEKSSK